MDHEEAAARTAGPLARGHLEDAMRYCLWPSGGEPRTHAVEAHVGRSHVAVFEDSTHRVTLHVVEELVTDGDSVDLARSPGANVI